MTASTPASNVPLFAQPVLGRVRDLVRAACPQVEEPIEWGMPGFGTAAGA